MRLLLVPVFLLSIIFSGCTYNLGRQDYSDEKSFISDINETSEGRKARIETRDSTFEAAAISAEDDSLKGIIRWNYDITPYTTGTAEKNFSIPNYDIKTISVTQRTGSITEGMGAGALAGISLGWFLAGVMSSNSSEGFPESIIAAEIGLLPGMVIGGIIGGIIGDDYAFNYKEKQNRESLYSDNAAQKYGIRFGYHGGNKVYLVYNKSYSPASASLISSEIPGFSVTAFYNYKFGKNFSLNNEISYISAGSDEQNSVYIPSQPLIPVRSQSSEDIKVLELASIVRLNLFKSGFTPYFLMGPRFDMLFPVSNAKSDFFYKVSSLYSVMKVRLHSATFPPLPTEPEE